MQNPVTEEQLEKLKKLQKKTIISSLLLGFKYMFILIAADIVIAIIDQAFVKSNVFFFIGCFGNVFLIMRSMNLELAENSAILKEEIKKILEN